MLPAQCTCATDDIQVEGRPFQGQHNEVVERHVSPEYLSALKAKLLRGRLFSDADAAGRPGVALISSGHAFGVVIRVRDSVRKLDGLGCLGAS